ncbi:hypothetical protein ACSSV1_003083 [Labrenzia sp. MBR-25]
MPLGIDSVKFEEFVTFGEKENYLKAILRFQNDEIIDQHKDVTHHVALTVRVKIDENMSLAEIRQLVLQKSLEQLKLAIDRCDGKTAQELIEETKAETKSRQETYQAQQDLKMREIFEK